MSFIAGLLIDLFRCRTCRWPRQHQRLAQCGIRVSRQWLRESRRPFARQAVHDAQWQSILTRVSAHGRDADQAGRDGPGE
ncbi:hypothetical protein PWP93_28330 [Paraburkholderia sp. A1RI-2L]|uniref:hypothetical protein n=1 Tax=Paraburkholderia sp. A1RI-2L TaxID=3028367 RepID=UPI003B7CA6E8